MSIDPHVIRILDASLNRAAEGLRVVEDYTRFVLDDGHLTELLKQLRHDLAAAAAVIPTAERSAARDTPHDVGTAITTPSESTRTDAWAVCQASLERTKQSLRSLEEYSKVAAPAWGAVFESLRYRLYTIEAALGRTIDAADRLADMRLCVLIDGCECEPKFEGLVREIVAAGVGAIQLRDKVLPVRQLVGRARLLMHLVSSGSLPLEGRAGEGGRGGCQRSTPLPNPPPQGEGTGEFQDRVQRPLIIINDRPAVAAAVNADGVHLGQDDFTVKDARAVLGPRKLIGVSCHSIEQARQAVLDGANYLGVGPTFPSATKHFDAFPGVELLKQVASEIRLPAFAIGGITIANVRQVREAGFAGIAVSSAVTSAPSPAAAAQELLAALDNGP